MDLAIPRDWLILSRIDCFILSASFMCWTWCKNSCNLLFWIIALYVWILVDLVGDYVHSNLETSGLKCQVSRWSKDWWKRNQNKNKNWGHRVYLCQRFMVLVPRFLIKSHPFSICKDFSNLIDIYQPLACPSYVFFLFPSWMLFGFPSCSERIFVFKFWQ